MLMQTKSNCHNYNMECKRAAGPMLNLYLGARIAGWQSAGLMIKTLRVSIPARAAGTFSSPELTLCANCYLVSIPPLCTAVACKRPQSFCQKCRWLITPRYNIHPLTQQSQSGLTMRLCRHSVQNLSGNEITHGLSGNARPQSFQLAEPLWTDPGLQSGISVHDLISTLKKKKKKCSQGMNC